MNSIWQIQDAKNKLSEVINRAVSQGPQVITRHGEKTAVVVSYVEYESLRKSQGKLSAFFQTSPLVGVDLTRDVSPVRPGIEL